MIPQSLATVVEAIGPCATVSIIQVYSGGPVWIPRPEHLKDTDPIVELLGMPLAKRLANAVGGERLDIPKGKSLVRRLRTKEIIRRWRRGLTYKKVAEMYETSEEQIYRWLREAEQEAESA